ncbi:MAG: DPP IV N-terminal domain-containing protein, partial [Elusimicrobiota bacterium]|nr:DPP IV N-terminal domain-containing protein [Elusimicrobiota bacterium]
MKKFKLFLVAALLLPLLCFAKESDVYIGISSKYNPDLLPKIGLAGFYPKDSSNVEEKQTATALGEVVRADLMRARYFDLFENMEPVDVKNLGVYLAKYKSEGVNYVLFAQVSASDENQWDIKAFLYDTDSQKAVLAKNFKSSSKSLRRTAHLLSDNIVKLLTGRRGIADTKIAFSNDSTRRKEIYMVDYDGYNLKKLTKDNSIALLPRWSSDATKIYYTTYRRGNPDVFFIDLKEGKIKSLLRGKGLNLIGGVSPDDKFIVLTLSRGDNPNIYLHELESGLLRRLTDKYGVDGSPSFSPDGKFVTFVSNRSGNPQVYIMELATKETRRLTKLNWTDTPQWSPTGDWIAFAGRSSANHPIDIFKVDITGSQLVQLTFDSGSNEDPTWSPDG